LRAGYARWLKGQWERKAAGTIDCTYRRKPQTKPAAERQPAATVWSEETELAALAAAPIEEQIRLAHIGLVVLLAWFDRMRERPSHGAPHP
jgi:hypothetical protein